LLLFAHKNTLQREETKDSHLLLSQGLEIGRILRVSLPASRTQLILVRTDPMPAEPTDLIATRARKETQIVHFQWFHTQRTFGQLITAAGIENVHDDDGNFRG